MDLDFNLWFKTGWPLKFKTVPLSKSVYLLRKTSFWFFGA